MALLFLDALPPMMGKGAILHLLIEEGGITFSKIGLIELQGRRVTIEVPDKWARRLANMLDGLKLDSWHIRAWSQSVSTNEAEEDHFQRLLRLLELEAQAEEAQTQEKMARYSAVEAERRGNTLIGLTIRDESGGLGGRVLVTLGKRNQKEPLPWTRLGVGTPVLLSQEGRKRTWAGVVSQRREYTIQVALSQWPEAGSDRATFRLDLSGHEVAHQRQRAALEKARFAKGDRLSELRRVLLREQEPSFRRGHAPLQLLDQSLNQSQQEAIRFALSINDVGLIHGPPGTGKTTTVVELIRQVVRRGEKVLACAPSNLAVDNIFERLLAAGEKVLRLGHPARVLPELRDHTLDLLIDKHPNVTLARKLERDGYRLRKQANKRSKLAAHKRRTMREEAKQILADARRLEAQALEQVIDSADILCATTTSLDSKILGRRKFDLCVIDEAAQSTEAGTWLPILRSKRLILAGDHYQLSPTIISKEAAKEGLGVSMMERLMKQAGAPLWRRLTTQYRMNQAIMDFSSREFYQFSLEADPSVEHHLLSDLDGVEKNDLTATAIHFIDTAGAGYNEELESNHRGQKGRGQSRQNPPEAELVCCKIQAFIDAGVTPSDIAVITPYAAQVRLLREICRHREIEIGTVDGFQGREKEVIIISLVRSNQKGEIGFLANERRMNVALTRARRKLLVIGDSATIATHPFYERLLDYFDILGAYHSVWDEV
ncbi:MAG: AAA domain-containing protein [Ardenticatenaceae bacterium]